MEAEDQRKQQPSSLGPGLPPPLRRSRRRYSMTAHVPSASLSSLQPLLMFPSVCCSGSQIWEDTGVGAAAGTAGPELPLPPVAHPRASTCAAVLGRTSHRSAVRPQLPTASVQLRFSQHRPRFGHLRPPCIATSTRRSSLRPPPALSSLNQPRNRPFQQQSEMKKMGIAVGFWPVLAAFPSPDARLALGKVNPRVEPVVLKPG